MTGGGTGKVNGDGLLLDVSVGLKVKPPPPELADAVEDAAGLGNPAKAAGGAGMLTFGGSAFAGAAAGVFSFSTPASYCFCTEMRSVL